MGRLVNPEDIKAQAQAIAEVLSRFSRWRIARGIPLSHREPPTERSGRAGVAAHHIIEQRVKRSGLRWSEDGTIHSNGELEQ
jgi:hypothetical protein